jgi:hypothetical protein
MNGHMKVFAAIALVAPVMAGCATKGFVREHVAAEQVRADAHADSAVSAERSARMSADSSLTQSIASRRSSRSIIPARSSPSRASRIRRVA